MQSSSSLTAAVRSMVAPPFLRQVVTPLRRCPLLGLLVWLVLQPRVAAAIGHLLGLY